jgi:hypothetical protein
VNSVDWDGNYGKFGLAEWQSDCHVYGVYLFRIAAGAGNRNRDWCTYWSSHDDKTQYHFLGLTATSGGLSTLRFGDRPRLPHQGSNMIRISKIRTLMMETGSVSESSVDPKLLTRLSYPDSFIRWQSLLTSNLPIFTAKLIPWQMRVTCLLCKTEFP